MRRGTTPTNVFTVDVELEGAEALYITYRQLNRIVIEKTLEDVTITPGSGKNPETLSVSLSQTDTLRLKNGTVDIQIRARFPNGEAIASEVMTVPVDVILKEGVI